MFSDLIDDDLLLSGSFELPPINFTKSTNNNSE